MLTRAQVYAMLMLRKRGNNIFADLPVEMIAHISDIDTLNSEINIALRDAALGEQTNLDNLVEMVKANPRLLLQAGNVTTRGGTEIIRTTLYEFFLGSGYTEAAELIAPYFAEIVDKDGESIGEAERARQYERYRPHIEQLRQDVNAYKQAYEDAGNSAYNSTYKPAYDLRPLIDFIINTTNSADVTAELQQTEGHHSELRDRMCAFREAINESQRSRTVGMHYAHYTTIMQVLHLSDEKWWPELSVNGTNYDKCRLVFSQLFGYLELVGLPARERFVFARAFADSVLSLTCKYDTACIFPDFDFSNLVRTGLGFDFGIIGLVEPWVHMHAPFEVAVINHMLSKNSKLSELMHTPQPIEITPSRCVLL